MPKRHSTVAYERYRQMNDNESQSWLTSYSDLMTILLVFFVMLISASHISAVKFEQIKQAFQGSTDKASIAFVLSQLNQQIADNNLSELVKLSSDGESVKINFHDRLLFDLGRAEVNQDGLQVIAKFSTTLKNLPDNIRIAVEGYTDDNPVNPSVYASNWHLSALRSLSVLEILAKEGVCQENCQVRGFGEFHPKMPNRNESGQPIAENQSQNRRVVIRIF